MRQKLIISSAFVHRPEVIVVDEPMVGLDPKSARMLKDLFREYAPRRHDHDEHAHARGRGGDVRPHRASSTAAGSRAAARWTSCALQTASGEAGLEEIFLRLTGGHAARELSDVFES